MITAAMSRRAQELAASRVAFVTATVVRVQHPTSAKAGNVALVLGDGTLEGFIGGVCAEQSVRAYALVALQGGEPVLLRITPGAAEADGGPADVRDGVVTVENPCLSGGAIEVFLEPTPPSPRVVVVGDTPIADAIRRIGGELGLEVVAAEGDEPGPDGGDLAVVVASHGRDELRALRTGLESAVPYVGLVASVKRGAGVLDELRAEGVPGELLERVDVPAGLAIGASTEAEIALSILAKIVSVRRGDTAVASGPLAVDPVCGMSVAAVAGTLSVRHDEETVYFCGEGCKHAFQALHEHAAV